MTYFRSVTTVGVVLMMLIAGCSGASNSGSSSDPTPEGGAAKAGATTQTTTGGEATEPATDTPTATESLGVETYTQSDENSSFVMRVDHPAQAYDIRIVSFMNTTEWETSEYFSTRSMVNLTLRVGCGALREIAYNESRTGGEETTTTPEGDSPPLVRTGPLGHSDTVDEVPERVFDDYQPRDLEWVVEGKSSGETLGRCSVPSETTIETTILVDD